jgi:peptidoglycan/xylan/chitin deacetylase (PgdA/CDA1 family)
MKKWWFLVIIIMIISIAKSGQAITLPRSIDKTPNIFFNSNESLTNKRVNSANWESNQEKLENNRNFHLKYVAEYLGNKFIKQVEIPKVELLPEPNPKVFKPLQVHVQVKEKPIQKEKPKPNIIVKPSVYLTFDDGPNHELNQILTILKAKKAKGTFFMIEPQMRHYQDSVKRLVNEGNYPALHSVTHDKNKLYGGSPLNVVNEMEKTRKTLLEITGFDSKLTRAPYGSKPYMKDTFRNVLVQHQMKMWDWNIDTMDWKYQRSNPHQILVNAINGLERVKNKKGPIVILMHVTKGTATVLPQVIDYLYSKGYQCPAYDPSKHVIMNFWNDTRL